MKPVPLGLTHLGFIVICIFLFLKWGAHFGSIGLLPLGPMVFLGLLPLLFCFWPLRLSLNEMGLCRVQRSPAALKVLAAAALLAPPIIIVGMKTSEAENFYGALFGAGSAKWGVILRLSGFAIASTLLLEFFFRSFCLMGLRRYRFLPVWALGSLVVVGEIVAHIQKPAIEALGMGVLSVALCWISQKTASIWLAVLLHLWIEIWFVFSFLV